MGKLQLGNRVIKNFSYLEGGIHDNCVIADYHSMKDSSPNKQIFITFVKLDDDDNEIGRKEVSWFQFDHNGKYILPNTQEYFTQITNVLELRYTREEVEAHLIPFRDTDIESAEDVKEQIKRKSELTTIFKNTQEDLESLFTPIVEDYKKGIFMNKCRLKLTLKNGYVNPPSYGKFVESMSLSENERVLRMTIPEQKELSKNVPLINASKPEVESKSKTREDFIKNMESVSTEKLKTQL